MLSKQNVIVPDCALTLLKISIKPKMHFYTELLGLDCDQLMDKKHCLFILITFKNPGLNIISPHNSHFK